MARKAAGAVVAVAAALAMAGCELSHSYATDVTETTARLNAVGATGDAPAWYHFEYARREADLGTGAGRRTPERGPIPAHTPSSGTLTFGEDVSGLSPGRLYVTRICARRGAMTVDVCSPASPFFTRPTADQDWVVGAYGTDPFGPSGSVEAAASAKGRRADGWLESSNRAATFSGRVTCLRIRGNRAIVGAVGIYDLRDELPGTPHTLLVTIVDDPAGDRWDDVAVTPGTTRPRCRTDAFDGVVSSLGDITVHDAR